MDEQKDVNIFTLKENKMGYNETSKSVRSCNDLIKATNTEESHKKKEKDRTPKNFIELYEKFQEIKRTDLECHFKIFLIFYKKEFNDFSCDISKYFCDKNGDSSSCEEFFKSMDSEILSFFNKMYMAKLYDDFKEKEQLLSIINVKNIISRKLLENIIEKIAYVSTSRYFNLLLDYIFFKNSFIIDETNLQNNDNIFDRYISYYGGLSTYNTDNYSYIYEYNYKSNNLSEYNDWNEYIQKEYKKEELNIFYQVLDGMSLTKNNIKEDFYDAIFNFLNEIMSKKYNIKREDINYINAIIKLIILPKSNNKKNIFKIYKKYT